MDVGNVITTSDIARPSIVNRSRKATIAAKQETIASLRIFCSKSPFFIVMAKMKKLIVSRIKNAEDT